MKKKLISTVIATIAIFSLNGKVFAQEPPPFTPIEPPNVPTDLGKFISAGIQLMLIIAGLATFLYLVLGGFSYITSGGDKTAVESAKNKLTYAFIGFFIVVLAWAITKLMGFLFGIDIFDLSKLPKFV
jgi:hypothetical protein